MRVLKMTMILAVAAMAVSVPVFAQTSPTNVATAGVFTTDVENSMNVHTYSDVVFEKWAGFAGVDSEFGPTMASIGYARKFGGTYLGLWYNGNFLSTDSTRSETVRSYYDVNNQRLAGRDTIKEFQADSVSSNNSIQALIGIAGMGIKVGFHEDLTTWNNPDNPVTIIDYMNGTPRSVTGRVAGFSQIEGVLTPSLGWGTSIALKDEQSIRPYVELEFGIGLYNSELKTRADHNIDAAGKVIGIPNINIDGRKADFLAPKILIGAEMDVKNSTVGISYELGFDIFDNKYNIAGYKGSVAGTVDSYTGSTSTAITAATTTTTKIASLNLTDRSAMSHTIIPSIYRENQAAEDLKIGFYAEVPFVIGTSSESAGYTRTNTRTEVKYNDTNFSAQDNTVIVNAAGRPDSVTNVTSLQISPRVAVGAMYDFVPGKFSVNAGLAITPLVFTSTTTNVSGSSVTGKTTTTRLDSNGNKVDETIDVDSAATIEDSQSINDNWQYLGIYAAAGFKFNFNNNIGLDMAVNGGTEAGDFVLNLTTVQVLFTFKF